MEEDNMKFYDEEHKLFYKGKVAELENLKCNNSYYRALVYALSLSPETRKNFAKIFDIENGEINIDILQENIWFERDSKNIIRLAFNLFNGCIYESLENAENKKISKNYGIDTIFASKYAKYFVEAIKLKYPEYFKEYQAHKVIKLNVKKTNKERKDIYGIYIRVGYSINELDGNIQYQEKEARILDYCKKEGINVTKIYTDIGYSGKIEGRVALRKIVDDVNAGKLTGIIAINGANLFRDDREKIDKFIDNLRGKIFTIEDGFIKEDPSLSAEEQLKKFFFEAMKKAEEERRKKIKVAKELKKKQRDSR